MDDLTKFREKINEIDAKLLQLIADRISVVKEVGEYKKENGLQIVDPEREEKLLQTLTEKGKKLGLTESVIRKIWKQFFEISYRIEK